MMQNKHLIKLFRHFANDVSMLHIVIHVRRNATTAARTMNEELNEFKQCSITILLVCLNPFINNSLETQPLRYTTSATVRTRTQLITIS